MWRKMYSLFNIKIWWQGFDYIPKHLVNDQKIFKQAENMTFTNGFDYVYFSEVKFLQVYDRKFIVLDHNDTSNSRVYVCILLS